MENEWKLIGYSDNIPTYYKANGYGGYLKQVFFNSFGGSEVYEVRIRRKAKRDSRTGFCNMAFDLLDEYLKN